MVSSINIDQEISLTSHYTFYPKQKLGSGAFGDIFYGVNILTRDKVAIKMEPSNSRHPQLKYETEVLKYLNGGVGIPNVFFYTHSNDYNFMVLDLLGLSLEALLNKCHKKFSLKTILMLGEQMLARIEYMHKRHYIHRDIKPDNFLMGIEQKSSIVYIIDFGLAKKFRDRKTGDHIPYIEGKNLTGTARYSSIYTHLGIEQSRRDDLESLSYSLIYLYKGYLPWQRIKAKCKTEKYAKILDKKVNVKYEELYGDLPNEFHIFLEDARSLQFEEKPNYEQFKQLLSTVYQRMKFENDLKFDWEIKGDKVIKGKTKEKEEEKNGNVIEEEEEKKIARLKKSKTNSNNDGKKDL